LEIFFVPPVEKVVALQIARQHVNQLGAAAGVSMVVSSKETIEFVFGWVFFYSPKDSSARAAGNAPIIVDREDGSVHPTGTAYPIEQYLESYARIRRPYPFATPEHLVVLYGCKPGMQKLSITKAVRSATGKGVAEAKACTDRVLAGRSITLSFPSAGRADDFCAEVQGLGASARREARYR
jgi:hypothetical protein